MDQKQFTLINTKLDILISLLLEKRQKENKLSDEEQTLFLSYFGMSPSEMAPLLNKSANAVRILLTRLRKKNKLG